MTAKDVRQLLDELDRQGFTLRRTTRHVMAIKDRKTVTIPLTPSSYRGLKNTVSALRRAGYVPPGRGQ